MGDTNTINEVIKFSADKLSFDMLDSCLVKFNEFAKAQNIDPKTNSVGCIIIDEVVNNIVSYSGATEFETHMVLDNGKVYFIFKDNGAKYDPTVDAIEEAKQHQSEGKPGGFGTNIICTLADTTYRYENGFNILETHIK